MTDLEFLIFGGAIVLCLLWVLRLAWMYDRTKATADFAVNYCRYLERRLDEHIMESPLHMARPIDEDDWWKHGLPPPGEPQP